MRLKLRVWRACRAQHYSVRTAKAYWGWIERFLRAVRERHGRWVAPEGLDAADVERFLTDLGQKRCRIRMALGLAFA